MNNPLSLNLYAYVSNNPLTFADLTGHMQTKGADSIGADGGPASKTTWQQVKSGAVSAANFLVVDDVRTIFDPHASGFDRTLALAGFLPVGKAVKGGKLLVKLMKKKGGKVVEGVITKTAKNEKAINKVLEKSCNCFVAGTEVQTDEGEKNIEDIEVGDKVLSKNEETGEVAYKEVTATFDHETDEIYQIHVGDQVIESTYNHPFWVEGKGWTYVKDLKVGDLLVQSDGNTLKIENVELLHKQATVYNMTVDEFHTYFVSDLGIWVHNTNCTFSTNFDTKKHAQDIYETSRDLGTPVTKGDKEGMRNFVASIVKPGNRANSKSFAWNTLESVDAYVKGDAVVLVNRATNEVVTFLNKKGGRLSNFLQSQLDLIE
ncbi:Hint module [compost metagenome]